MKSNDSGLPHAWCNATISEITAVNPTLDKAGIPDDLEISFVPMPAVQAENGIIDVSGIRKFSDVRKGYTPFREGDVLFAKITPCMENGKMAVVPEVRNGIGFGSTEFHVLRAQSGVDAKYVYYYVSSQPFRRVAEHNMSGAVGQRRVTTPYLSDCEVPLPPSNEQHRIVAKIEELFSELDKGIENLKTAQAQLKVYRQALLKHAFEGKLTAQWRAENQDKLETAAALLKRIQQERAQRYQQQLADWQTNGGSKPKVPKPLPPLTAEELAELPELPKGWGWTRVRDLADKVTDGEHITPRRTDSGFYLLSARNIQNGYLDLSNVDYVPQDEYERIRKRCNPEEGDILISCSGSIGRICRVPKELDFVMVRSVAVVKLQNAIESSKFYEYLFQSPLLQRQIEKGKKATAQANLFLEPINNLKVIVCSKEEQMKIIGELESRLSEVDHLELTITTSLQQTETLRQSILKKAFSGQLVPQDPHDEPASELLARIKAERESGGKSPAVRRSRAKV
jgi:type I restriction enzyme S subunit